MPCLWARRNEVLADHGYLLRDPRKTGVDRKKMARLSTVRGLSGCHAERKTAPREMISSILFSVRRLDPRLESKVRVVLSQNLEDFSSRHGLTAMEKHVLPLLIARVARIEIARSCAVSPRPSKLTQGISTRNVRSVPVGNSI